MRVPMTRSRRIALQSLTGMVAATDALCIIIIFILGISVVVDGATDPNDVSALNTLFTDFNSDGRLLNWVQSAGDPCGNNWLGVTCEGTFVISIKLPGMGLTGKVQGWVLQSLKQLSLLDLSQNHLNSKLPDMFPPNLTDLNLSNNQFTGTFPYLLINVPSLISITLNNNYLDGTLNGQIFSKLGNVTTLDISNNAFTGPIPETIGDMVNLQYLYLQNNKLTGPIPSSLSNLLLLNTLDISNNMLTGYLPPNLNPINFRHGGNQLSQRAPPPPPYTSPPDASPPASDISPPASDISPPASDISPPPPKSSKPPPPPKVTPLPDSSPSTSSNSLSGSKIIALIVVVILVFAAAGVAVWFFVIRNRPERLKNSDIEANHSSRRAWFLPLIPPGKEKTEKMKLFEPGDLACCQTLRSIWGNAEKSRSMKVFEPDTFENGMEEQKIKASPPVKTLKVPPAFKRDETIIKKPLGKLNRSSISATAFTVADLQEATNSFSQANLLGEGALGCVYRAEFPNGRVLVVKKLDTSASMVQNEDDFLGVVDGVARLQHTNSAELMGYCIEHGQRLLVYEYIRRGTLNDVLHGRGSVEELSWNMRVKIALGAARALEYLHEVCSPAVVHRNFKSANILLDDDLNPHVSDCGLAALAPSRAESQLSAQMLSSVGYSAPEYSMSGTSTVKSDVYSFGVVMLELLTGRKPFDSSRPRSEQSLVRWATPQLHDIDALARMVDPALEGVYPVKSLSRFADIVASCVQPEPEFRPPMSEVVQSLVRLMQRATLSKRRTGSDSGTSQTDIPDAYEYL